MTIENIRLSCLPPSWKILFTGFVLILSCGYLAAVTNAKLAVGMTPAIIADHYGDKSLNQIEKQTIAAQGFVEEAFSFDDEPQMDMGNGHGGMKATEGMMAHDRPADDDSLSPQIMAQLSHIHWLGFSLLLFCIGSLFCLTCWPELVKASLITVLCVSFFADILGLNLTRFVSDGFALMTVVSGTLVGVCIATMSLRILWELWLKPKNKEV